MSRHTTPAAPALPAGLVNLTVERLRLSVLEEPLSDPVPMAIGSLDARRVMLVEVEAGGEWGLGETWVNHPEWACRERLLTFRHGIAPLLVGRDVCSPRTVLDGLVRELMPRAEQGGVAGSVWQALSGLDLALWDLLGKVARRSVATLLDGGGVPKSSVEVYASGIGPTKVEELSAVAAEQGVGAVKARVGFGLDTDVRTLATIRRELGDDVLLFVDANRAWSFDEAVNMGAVLADHGCSWVEEPLRDERPDALAELFSKTGLPVAVGENIYGLSSFDDYLARTPLAVVQPDPAKSGGLTTCAAVARWAASRGVDAYPHCYSGGVALAASVLLAAGIDNVRMVEVDVRPSALRSQLLDANWRIVDGELAVPQGPGLGISLDPEVRSRYLVAEDEVVVA